MVAHPYGRFPGYSSRLVGAVESRGPAGAPPVTLAWIAGMRGVRAGEKPLRRLPAQRGGTLVWFCPPTRRVRRRRSRFKNFGEPTLVHEE